MKKPIFAVVLLVLFGRLAGVNLGAQESAQAAYHLVVIDRTKCPGAVVEIDEPLSVTSHGRTGYYIVFGRGEVTLPSGAVALVNLASTRLSVISEYLSAPAFRRYVSNAKILEGIRFAIRAAGR